MNTLAETDRHETGRSLGRWLTVAEIALILAVFFIHAGFPVPDDNEAHYLCKAKHYWNPTWCEGDFFLDSADAHIVFYWSFGWVTKFVSLPAAAWIGRVLTWSLLAWAWQRLSWRLVPRPLISVLTAALFVTFNDRADLAGEWVVGGVEAKGFAYVLVLIGLERAFSNRWNAAWIAIGSAAAFHVLVGGWTVVALSVAWLACRVYECRCRTERDGNAGNRPPPFTQMLPGLIGGGAIALLGLLPALALTREQPADLTAHAAQIYVFERLPHHLAILHLSSEEMVERLVRHGYLVVGLGLLWWWGRRSGALSNSTSAAGCSNLAEQNGSLSQDPKAPTPNPSPEDGRGGLGKGSDDPSQNRASGAADPSFNASDLPDRLVRGAATPLQWRLLIAFSVAAFGIAICGFAIEAITWQIPTTAAQLLRYYWFRITDFALPLSVAMFAGAVVADCVQRHSILRVAVLIAALGYAGWHLADLTYLRFLDPRPRGEARLARGGKPERIQRVQGCWLDACQWIRERTPPGSVVLSSRRNQTLKWRTGRAEIVSRKDIPQDAAGIVEWSRRNAIIHTYVDSEGERQKFKSLAAAREQHILSLAEEFDFDYILTRSRPVLQLPIMYRNRQYTVYEAPGP